MVLTIVLRLTAFSLGTELMARSCLSEDQMVLSISLSIPDLAPGTAMGPFLYSFLLDVQQVPGNMVLGVEGHIPSCLWCTGTELPLEGENMPDVAHHSCFLEGY